MKWLKNKSFLILLAGIGVVYLSLVDGWQVYAEPLAQVKSWYQKFVYGEPAFSESVYTQAQDDRETGGSVETEETGADSVEIEETEGLSGEADSQVDGQTGEGADAVSGENAEGAESADGAADDGLGGDEPVYMTVEDDYFSDAVFIGDSRTVGMYEYGALEEITTFYASKGLTVYKLFDSEIVEVPGQRKKQTVEEALQEKQFKKIYLMVGINEMGTGTVETFAAKYGEVVEHLLELQPDAILYIQGILKVTTERSQKGDYITNEGIEERNEAIAQLADNRRIFYLDANPLICDETGGMEPSYTFDGVHLKAQYIDIWKDYLKSHAVDLERF